MAGHHCPHRHILDGSPHCFLNKGTQRSRAWVQERSKDLTFTRSSRLLVWEEREDGEGFSVLRGRGVSCPAAQQVVRQGELGT